MSSSHSMIQFIQTLSDEQLFNNRELLRFGSRALVDKVLSNLAKAKTIVRIAQGVYRKATSHFPTLQEVISFKAKLFNRRVMPAGENEDSGAEIVLFTDGATSSFRCLGKTVRFAHKAPGRLLQFFGMGKRYVDDAIETARSEPPPNKQLLPMSLVGSARSGQLMVDLAESVQCACGLSR